MRANNDYIIDDSSPVGMVSDGLILGEYADTVLYLVRQRYTLKKQLEFVNELSNSHKLNDVGIIFNDVKRGGKIGYYGYGNTYGKRYGYEAKAKTRFRIGKKREKPVTI